MMLNFVKKYNESGIACFPATKEKQPVYGCMWKTTTQTAKDFKGAEFLAIKCGLLSGGLECLDFDNHFGDAEIMLKRWSDIKEVKEILSKYKFPIEKSQNGGFHLFYRSEKISGNKKLALRWNPNKLPKPAAESIIETRGEGGYVVVYPSPNYTIQKNDIFKPPTITAEERDILIYNAASLNEYIVPIRGPYESEKGDRPGDIYNSDSGSVDDMKNILTENGWKQLDRYKWRRPGKKDGSCSATLGYVAENIFYVFSSGASPFEQETPYTPFQVLALLKYNGDFSEAAKSVKKEIPEIKPTAQTIQKQQNKLDLMLMEAWVDTTKDIEKPPTLVSIRECYGAIITYKRLFCLGDFSCIIGKSKSKKTYLLTMITAAIVGKNTRHKFKKEPTPGGKEMIIYVDTEQGGWDSQNCMKRIEKMANSKENFKGYNLRKYTEIERCEFIEYLFQLYGDKILYFVIDGIADLIVSVNDEEGSKKVVNMLMRLTATYNTHISCVIHQNKSDNYATGHLGSSVMKKAEVVISVTNENKGSRGSVASCDYSRGMPFEDFGFFINEHGLPELNDEPTIDANNSYYEKESDELKFLNKKDYDENAF